MTEGTLVGERYLSPTRHRVKSKQLTQERRLGKKGVDPAHKLGAVLFFSSPGNIATVGAEVGAEVGVGSQSPPSKAHSALLLAFQANTKQQQGRRRERVLYQFVWACVAHVRQRPHQLDKAQGCPETAVETGGPPHQVGCQLPFMSSRRRLVQLLSGRTT